jgi:hypothetical protein
MPLAKRLNTDQSFLNDVLVLNMISLSSGSTNKNTDSQATDVVLQMPSTPTYQANIPNSHSSLGQTNGTGDIPKPISTNTSAMSKQLMEPSKYTNTNMEQKILMSQSIPEANSNNSTCIWPVEISYQPDFVEIVVTDDEINAYWDTVKDFF